MAASILQVAASHGLSNRAIIHAGGAQNPARGKVRFQADWPLPHRAFLSTSPPCSRRFKKQGGCLYPLRNTSSIPAASLRRLQLWMKLACFFTSPTRHFLPSTRFPRPNSLIRKCCTTARRARVSMRGLVDDGGDIAHRGGSPPHGARGRREETAGRSQHGSPAAPTSGCFAMAAFAASICASAPQNLDPVRSSAFVSHHLCLKSHQ
jgi:hypothetical protein